MAGADALDLSAIDPPVWRIVVDEIVYGPYTLGQMRSFAGEGRLSQSSKVAEGDGGAFIPAHEHEILEPLFTETPSGDVQQPETATANYLITIQADADGRRAVIALLNQLGRFSELMAGTFILRGDIPVFDLRAQLSTVLAERGRFVIVNGDTGQLAWAGLGTDADYHAGAIWKRDS